MIVDASVLVAAHIDGERNHLAARAWLEQALRGSISAPTLVLAEVSAAIARGSGSEALAERAVAMLRREPLTLVDVDAHLAFEAAEIARRYRIRGCDAIYVALAVRRGDVLITLDEEQLTRGGRIAAIERPPLATDPANGGSLDTGAE